MVPKLWKLSTALVAALALLAVCTSARADDLKATDAKIAKAVVDAINLGVPLYNSGDAYGCYRLYQGTAMGLVPLTSGHPSLAGVVEEGIKKAETMGSWATRATALRGTLDEVLAASTGKAKPLWDRLGGEPAVKAVIHDFVGIAATDPKVDFTRGGKYPLDAAAVADLEKKLVELVSAVSGGPFKYTGAAMKPAHAGMGITDAQFDAIAGDLIGVLKKYNVPKKEADELVAAVASTRKEMVEVPKP